MKKEKKVSSEEKVTSTVKKPAVKEEKISGYKKESLNEELERLAQMFRDELENQAELDNEGLEEEEEYLSDEKGIIYEDEVCECCGEKRKAKGIDFCPDCRDAMRRYPFSTYAIVLAVVMVVFAIVSVVDFSKNFDGYFYAEKAKTHASHKELNSALDFYDQSIAIFTANGVNAKKLKFECVDVMSKTSVVATSDILAMLSSAFDGTEATLPIYASKVMQYDELYVLRETMNMMFDIENNEAYADANTDEEVYKEAMTAIGALIDQEITVTSLDGKSRTYKTDEGVIRFCQYTYAYLHGNMDDVYYYVNETHRLIPDQVYMYGYDMGSVCAQTREFDKALQIADVLISINVEDGAAYCLYSSVERMKGNYDKAIEWAENGLVRCPADVEIMRMASMAYAAKGDLNTAKQLIDDAMTMQMNGTSQGAASDLIYAVSLVIENELGNEETVEYILSLYESAENIDVPDRVQQYLDGKLTVKQLFTEGTGEI